MIQTVILGIAMVLIIEGLVYALAPSLLRSLLEMIRTIPDTALRQVGLLAITAGLLLIWVAFQLGL